MFVYKKLGNFVYNIIEYSADIKPFLLTWLKREWELDIKEDSDQPWTKEWLQQLPDMRFELQVININKIKLKKELLNYKKGDYSFKKELRDRMVDREESILRGVSIEPLIVRKPTMELVDGYVRFFALKKLGEKVVYAYVAT